MVQIPEKVNVTIDAGKVTVKGPKGELSRSFPTDKVTIEKAGNEINATDMVRSGRLATTVRKQFIVAVVEAKGDRVDFLSFDWWRA
jgi:ribosomal protein L6P/L9E